MSRIETRPPSKVVKSSAVAVASTNMDMQAGLMMLLVVLPEIQANHNVFACVVLVGIENLDIVRHCPYHIVQDKRRTSRIEACSMRIFFPVMI
jgi:hypothetical protein